MERWSVGGYVWVFTAGLALSGGSDSKEAAGNAGDPGSIPGEGRSPEGGHGNPLQYSCLANLMDGVACWAAVHGVRKESDMTEAT